MSLEKTVELLNRAGFSRVEIHDSILILSEGPSNTSFWNIHLTEDHAHQILMLLNRHSLIQAGGEAPVGWYLEYSCKVQGHLKIRTISLIGFDDRFLKK